MKKTLLVLMALLAAVGTALAQPRTVTGVVTTAEDGSTLPQLTIQLKGTSTGVTTDLDGKYRIQVPGPEAVLVFIYVGMQTQEVVVGDRSVINVVMQPALEEIGTVMVMGYGTRGKNQVTGSSVQVEAEEMANVPTVSPIEALQGKVPGLVSNNTSSSPGSEQEIRVRGTGSLSASNEPLYVIDGVPMVETVFSAGSSTTNLSSLASINMNDVETFTLLKDASATAAYGARGSNGVIVITTKKGRKGKTNFNFSGHWGATIRLPHIELMTSQEQFEAIALVQRNRSFLAQLQKQNLAIYKEYLSGSLSPASIEVTNKIWEKTLSADSIQKLLILSDPMIRAWDSAGRPNYDIQKAYDRSFANVFNGVLSASGGGDNHTFYASLGANYTQNMVKYSDFQRVNGTLNFSRNFAKWLEFATNNTVTYTRQNRLLAEQALYYSSPIAAKHLLSPFLPPYGPDGKPNPDLGSDVYNFLILAEKDISYQSTLRGLTNTTMTATIIEGLKWKSRISMDYTKYDTKSMWNQEYGQGADYGGYSQRWWEDHIMWVTQNSLGYDFTLFDDHSISLLALQEFQKSNTDYLGGYSFTTPTDELNDLDSYADIKALGGGREDWSNAAYLGLLNYGYKNRYILDLTYRREASSRFPTNSRWGNFGSIGVAWNIHSEPFFEPLLDYLNSLRFRASWGISGNSRISINAYQALLGYSESYNSQPAGVLSGYGNPDLTWEKNATFDVGFEFGLWDDRITGSFAFFDKNTYDLLQAVPLTYTTGFSSVTRNVGSMNNRGVELMLDFAILRDRDYHLNVGMNLATLRNRVTKLAKQRVGDSVKAIDFLSNTSYTTENHMYDEWYVVKWAGVDEQTGIGLFYVDDTKKEKTADITKAKRYFMGASPMPKYTGGVSLHADYKGIYFDANVYFAGGHVIGDGLANLTFREDARAILTMRAYKQMYNNMWTKPGDKTDHPLMGGYRNQASSFRSDRNLYRGDHIRFKDITLGYNVPKNLLEKMKFHGTLSLYAKATNLFVYAFDKRVYYDPEVQMDGFTPDTNPPVRVFSVGINMNF